jgi:lactam utilization protein B
VANSSPKQGEIHALVKQKHVLEQTVNAYDRALSGHGHLQSRRLAVAAQHVVLQAAQTIVADRTVAVGGATTSEVESVSLHELTDKTQDAIAMAVKMNGPTSNEVDIIVAATSILKKGTPNTPPPPSMNARLPMAGPSTPRMTSAFPPPTSLSTLPEHV